MKCAADVLRGSAGGGGGGGGGGEAPGGAYSTVAKQERGVCLGLGARKGTALSKAFFFNRDRGGLVEVGGRGLGKGTAQPVLLDEEDGLATG